ncbi:MAG: chitobiase/beta-hexosaminidase C-terminal domain-containing protein, partial [Candidatus Moraniibacteriota bacterium]
MGRTLFLSVVIFSSVFFFSHYSVASASTNVSGTLSGSVTWTKAGSPYIANHVSIPTGASLTIEPGTVVKSSSWPLLVQGGSLAVGSPDAEPVIFTSFLDDSVGGDTNNDGSRTAPSATGDWYGISVSNNGIVTASGASFRYGGTSIYAVLSNSGGTVNVSQSDFSFFNHAVLTTSGTTTAYDNNFSDMSDSAILHKGGQLLFGSNTFVRGSSSYASVHVTGGEFQNAGGNSGEGAIWLGENALTKDTHLPKDGLPYVPFGPYNSYGLYGPMILAGVTVTIEPGAVIKLRGRATFNVFGRLDVGAPDAEPVVFTSVKDDMVSGDTNADGSATLPIAGDWCSLNGLAGGVLSLSNVIVKYGGCQGFGQVYNSGSTTTISKAKFSDSAMYHIFQWGGSLTLEDSELTGAASAGLYYVNGTSLAARNNSISGNTGYGARQAGLYPVQIDMTGNWWGDASGPYHKTRNPNGKGNAVSDYVLFDPWLGSDPLAEPVGCVENCFSNILFLPGLEASRLYRSDGNGEDRLWEPNTDSDAEDLFLDGSGNSIHDDIYTRDVIDNAYISIKGNIYKSLLADFDDWKNTDHLIADYAVAPYDWRLSLDDILNGGKKTGENISYTESTASPYIIGELRRLASTSKSGKVTLIAHSNGGLVAKALTDKLGTEAAELVDKIVFVAVPQSGTPQAIGAILHGYDQGLPVNWFPFTLTPKTARTLAQNMPSGYNLLPSDAYFSGEGSGVTTPVIAFEEGAATDTFISRYGNKIDSASELHDFLSDSDGKVPADSPDIASPSSVNAGLLAYGADTHQALDDSWSPPAGISVYQIAGFGEETLGTIKYWTGQDCVRHFSQWCLEYAPKLKYTPEMVVDGDGTVVAPSALAMSTGAADVSRWWVDLKKYDTFFNLARKHADILEVPQLRDFIKDNILTQSVATLPNFLSASKPPTSSDKRLRYFLHSPLALSAHDSTGNVISADEDSYPGAEYRRFGEVQYISLPATSNPTVVLDGQDEGSFTLEVQEVEGETIIATTTFAGIPSAVDTQVTMDFSDGTIADASPLTVDYDGDGTTDFSLEPRLGETVIIPIDATPPTTAVSLSGTAGTGDWYTSDVTVTLSAEDGEGGSGIEKIKYSLDDGATWDIYTGPFLLAKEGTTTIRYFASDKAGNKEAIRSQTVNIDKTVPEISFAFDPVTKALAIIGNDSVSTVTVDVSATGAVVTDEAGHTAAATFEKSEAGKQIKFEVQSLAYDDVAVSLVPAVLKYEWSLEKTENVKMLNELAIVGDMQIQAHYLAKDNITSI